MDLHTVVEGNQLINDTKDQTGYFLFSLDTELAWGYFDLDRLRSKKLSPDGSRERRSIELLLDVLDEFGIVGTWAVVGHLLYGKCEECDICPILEWRGKYRSFEEVYKTNAPLWYGADIVEALLTRGPQHEIAFHGHTHNVFDENTMSEEEARTEIQEWLRVSKRKHIIPRTVIFPRNKIGHLDLFQEYGFLCYRGKELMPGLCSLPLIGRVFRRFYYYLSVLSTPQVYEFKVEPSGLVNLPSSRWLSRFNRNLERILDSLNLHNLRINRIIKGVNKAADEKKIIHIWAHPLEFQTKKDIEKLRYLLGYVSDEVSKGRIESVGMADLARKAKELLTARYRIDPSGIEVVRCSVDIDDGGSSTITAKHEHGGEICLEYADSLVSEPWLDMGATSQLCSTRSLIETAEPPRPILRSRLLWDAPASANPASGGPPAYGMKAMRPLY